MNKHLNLYMVPIHERSGKSKKNDGQHHVTRNSYRERNGRMEQISSYSGDDDKQSKGHHEYHAELEREAAHRGHNIVIKLEQFPDLVF